MQLFLLFIAVLKVYDCFCVFRIFHDGRHFRVEQFEDARNLKGPALRPVPGMEGYLCPQKLTWKCLLPRNLASFGLGEGVCRLILGAVSLETGPVWANGA